MLPHSITEPRTAFVNTVAHTQVGTHWLAIRLEPRTSLHSTLISMTYPPQIHDIQLFLRRNCTVLHYNKAQLQGPLSTVCDKYCCLFVLYMVKGYTGREFVGLLTPGLANQQVENLFAREFVSIVWRPELCQQI
jgi:hypothetical protein